ncbi:MAG: hypothetical protein AAFR60_00115 [Pseudomonadota bacterium]
MRPAAQRMRRGPPNGRGGFARGAPAGPWMAAAIAIGLAVFALGATHFVPGAADFLEQATFASVEPDDNDATQPTSPGQTPAETRALKKAAEARTKKEADTVKAVTTLDQLLTTEGELRGERDTLRARRGNESDDGAKKELDAEIEATNAKLKEITAQVAALTAGTTAEEFESAVREKVDLQTEVESLLRPFVAMMRTATSGTRRIEELRSAIKAAKRRTGIAERAVQRLQALVANQQTSRAATPQVGRVLDDQLEAWRRRANEVRTEIASLEQQLELQIEEQGQAGDGIGDFLIDFITTRGANLAMGVGVFIAIFVAFRFVGVRAGRLQRQRGIPRSFATRLVTLVHKAMTVVVAALAMLAVFNWMNDWILLGLTVVVVLALAWIGLKMIPSIIEQVTLLLNLGAVQEGERIMLDGVPWRVERLDFYTDLVNPVLDGGEFTVPVRQLTGLRSRPAARNEAWFPTDRKDWLQLSDGRVGQVIVQTPELVQICELGGARLTFATSDFIERVGRNLSDGFRAEIEIGLDYAHQDIATDVVPPALAQFVREGLERMIGSELINVAVELKAAGASSIDFEVEADVKGSAADRYEDIEREIARLSVAACNAFGWTLALPQMVLHDAIGGGAGQIASAVDAPSLATGRTAAAIAVNRAAPEIAASLAPSPDRVVERPRSPTLEASPTADAADARPLAPGPTPASSAPVASDAAGRTPTQNGAMPPAASRASEPALRPVQSAPIPSAPVPSPSVPASTDPKPRRPRLASQIVDLRDIDAWQHRDAAE